MSIIGKMMIDGQSFNLLSYKNRFFQQRDIAGRPRGRVNGSVIAVTIAAHRDHIFHHWALQPEQMRDLELVFSPVTKVSKSRTIQLYDVYCVRLAVHFDNHTTRPMTYSLLLSPGIYVDGGVVFKKPWHVTDLDAMGGAEETDPGVRPKPKLLECYFENNKGKRVENPKNGEELNLIVKSQEMKGESIDIDLSDSAVDFEYEGIIIANDLLQDFAVTGDTMRITLKVRKQKTEDANN